MARIDHRRCLTSSCLDHLAVPAGSHFLTMCNYLSQGLYHWYCLPSFKIHHSSLWSQSPSNPLFCIRLLHIIPPRSVGSASLPLPTGFHSVILFIYLFPALLTWPYDNSHLSSMHLITSDYTSSLLISSIGILSITVRPPIFHLWC